MARRLAQPKEQSKNYFSAGDYPGLDYRRSRPCKWARQAALILGIVLGLTTGGARASVGVLVLGKGIGQVQHVRLFPRLVRSLVYKDTTEAGLSKAASP